MSQSAKVQEMDRSRLLEMIAHYNENKIVTATDKAKNVYDYAINIGYTPKQIHQIMLEALIVPRHCIYKAIPSAGRIRKRTRTPNKFPKKYNARKKTDAIKYFEEWGKLIS